MRIAKRKLLGFNASFAEEGIESSHAPAPSPCSDLNRAAER